MATDLRADFASDPLRALDVVLLEALVLERAGRSSEEAVLWPPRSRGERRNGAAAHEEQRSIRSLSAAELPLFREHLQRLDDSCRRSRFGNEVTGAFLEDYVELVDLDNTMILGFFEQGEVRGVVELRSLLANWCPEAEAAFSVERSWQGQGIGTALMREAIHFSRTLGIEQLHVCCDVRNRAMQRVVEKFPSRLSFADGECFATVAV
jgi:GNAT superfamily N-acetyltransferase